MSIANIARSYAKRFAYKKVSDSGLTSGINFESVTPENVTGILSAVNGKVNGLNLEMDSDVMSAIKTMESGTDIDLNSMMEQSDIDINSMNDEMGVNIGEYINESQMNAQQSNTEINDSIAQSDNEMNMELDTFDMDMKGTINDFISEYDPRSKAEEFSKSSWESKSLDKDLLEQYKNEAEQLLDNKISAMESEMEAKTNQMMAQAQTSQYMNSDYSNINYM